MELGGEFDGLVFVFGVVVGLGCGVIGLADGLPAVEEGGEELDALVVGVGIGVDVGLVDAEEEVVVEVEEVAGDFAALIEVEGLSQLGDDVGGAGGGLSSFPDVTGGEVLFGGVEGVEGGAVEDGDQADRRRAVDLALQVAIKRIV